MISINGLPLMDETWSQPLTLKYLKIYSNCTGPNSRRILNFTLHGIASVKVCNIKPLILNN
jgi:hypothetical protein